jgi:transcriptional regulator with XRE-family HTH domain
MKESIYQTNYQKLQKLIEAVEIVDVPALSQASGVSQWQISRLLHGLILNQSIATIIKLAHTLQIPISELIAIFAPEGTIEIRETPEKPKRELPETKDESRELKSLQQEYQHLQHKLAEQERALKAEFQKNSLEMLESWLVQWPTAATAAKGNAELPATRLLPLVKPVEKMIAQWGVEMIGSIGEEIAYDPQYHELMEGSATAGDTVKVRYVGYRQDDRLLHRMKVSPIVDRE